MKKVKNNHKDILSATKENIILKIKIILLFPNNFFKILRNLLQVYLLTMPNKICKIMNGQNFIK